MGECFPVSPGSYIGFCDPFHGMSYDDKKAMRPGQMVDDQQIRKKRLTGYRWQRRTGHGLLNELANYFDDKRCD